MAVISGVRGTNAVLAANVKPDIDPMLKVLEPYQTPFLTWLYFIKKDAQVVKNKYGKFEWFEREFYPHQTQVSAAISLTGSTLVLTSSNVDDVTFFNIGDIVLIEATGEMAYVSSGTVGTTVTLTHIDGSTSLTALASGNIDSYIKIIGDRNLEYTSTSGRLAVTQKEENVYNLLNTFTEYVTTSGREEAGEAYTDGMTHDELVEQKIKENKLKLERYFIHSTQRGYTTSGNERSTYGYGLEGFISTNSVSYTGALTESALRAYFKQLYAKGSNRRLHMAGSDQMAEIEAFMQDKYQLMQSPNESSMWKEYGVEAKTFRTFSGLTTIIWNPILDGKYVDYGFTVDEDNVKLRYMAPDKHGVRKFRLRKIDLSRNDGTETQILFDMGLQVELEETHGKLYKA